MVFLPNDATVYFRPLADGEGNFYAEKKRHQIIGDEKIEIACTGAGCAVCAKLEELPKWENQWQFRARPVTFGYGVIVEQMGLKKDFVKLGEPVLLVHKEWDFIIANIIEGLGTAEAIQAYADPTIPAYPAMVRTRKRPGIKKVEITVDIDCESQKITVPALPVDFPLLSDAYQLGADSQSVYKLIEAIKEDFEKDANILDPKPRPPATEVPAPAPATVPASYDLSSGEEPDDGDSHGPHPDCPTHYGGFQAGEGTPCPQCELWWDCRRVSEARQGR